MTILFTVIMIPVLSMLVGYAYGYDQEEPQFDEEYT